MKQTSKQHYNVFQNVGWMIGNAWRSCKSVLWMCVLAAALTVGVNLVQLFIAPQILSRVEQQAPLPELLGTIGVFSLALFLVLGLQAYVDQNTIFGRIEVRTGILNQIGYKTNTTSFSNTLDTAVLDLRDKANRAVQQNSMAGEHIWTTLTNLLANAAGFVLYLLLMQNLDPVLLAVVLATTLVSFLVTKRTNEWRYQHRDEEAKFFHQLRYLKDKSESVELAKDIRIFGLQPWLQGIYDSVLKLEEAFVYRYTKIQLLGNAVDVLLSVARNGIAYLYLINMALEGGLSASQFLLYFTAVSGFTNWITGILNESMTLHRESLDLSSIRDYLNLEEPFRFEGGKEIPAPGKDGYELRLQNVSFRYPKAEKDTIHNLNITVRPGEKLAIVGLNGAGKTTLVKLLCGLLDPTEGAVLLDGQDIRQFNRRDYYALFSAVFQEFSVLAATVAENVSQTVGGGDQDKVRACLDKAGLTEKIDSLPKGIDTQVGREVYEDGVLFSGGQTQRLMLARALYKDGPVLLLDEPTAALDPIAENDIYLKYNEMSAGKTSLFISHRLASTRFCDRIIFVAGGDIAEEGTHDELMQKGGGYAKLFEVQSRYYREGREF